MTVRTTILLALAVVGAAAASPAGAEITAHERAACIGDVRKLCPDELARHDVPGGIACLLRNRDRLSAPCRKVLADRGA